MRGAGPGRRIGVSSGLGAPQGRQQGSERIMGSGGFGRSRPGDSKADADSAAAKPSVAVALEYDSADANAAPIVSASGRGYLAERILAAAEEAGVPIRRDSDLVEILAATEIGEEIPVEAFIAVAEILSYIYRQNGQMPPSKAAGKVAGE